MLLINRDKCGWAARSDGVEIVRMVSKTIHPRIQKETGGALEYWNTGVLEYWSIGFKCVTPLTPPFT
jgi:hypothetical protein